MGSDSLPPLLLLLADQLDRETWSIDSLQVSPRSAFYYLCHENMYYFHHNETVGEGHSL